MKKYLKAMPSMILSLLTMLLAVMQPLTAFADDSEKKGYSLTVNFTADNGAIGVVGSEIRLYYALDDDGVLAGDFAQYADEIEVGDLETSEEVGTLATTLASYAMRDLEPLMTQTTDANGQAVFTDLESGIYLAVGSSATVDGVKYTPMATIVRVPYYDEEGSYITDVVINVKYDSQVLPIELSAKKVWADNNSPDRPKEVTVQLLKDGTAYDEVKLNADNNWTHTWTELDRYADWQVTELNVPEGYSVKITREGATFIVTNTAKDDNSTDTGDKDKDSVPDPNLPQTGQLWWPVPVLMILGMVTVLAGIIIKNLDCDEKK